MLRANLIPHNFLTLQIVEPVFHQQLQYIKQAQNILGSGTKEIAGGETLFIASF